MTHIVDRRLNGKNKSAVNRQRFIKRFSHQIKKAVSDAISGRSITDIDSGEKINIPSKDITEPNIVYGSGGKREIVHPGNREFITGDRIPRPLGGKGSGKGKASNSGEGVDDFVFELSREEFLNFFFDDLELPNMVKTKLSQQVDYKWVRAGYSTYGVPSNINVVRSMKMATSRRVALRGPHRQKIQELEEELALLLKRMDETAPRVIEIREEIRSLKAKMATIPFIDEIDLRFNNRVKQPKPTTQAVMFCLMDVSGSMGQTQKDMAKRFFTLLYLFLSRTYEKTQIIFIRHHTIAKEVDEEDFFYSRETGGTVVSSALELMYKIIQERFPTADWNIYAAQASDGDNWSDDSPICRDLLINSIMPCLQYYAYIEITQDDHQSLWREYLKIKEIYTNFAMQKITGTGDIFPVFRELFKKRFA